MRNPKAIFPALLLILAAFFLLAMTSLPSPAGRPTANVGTGTPEPTLTLTPTPTPPVSFVQNVVHTFMFPAATLSDTLVGVFSRAQDKEREVAAAQVAKWKQTIDYIVKPPRSDMYSQVARSSLPTAAALAIPLFLLRLAQYHWRRLTGSSEDSALRVVGDWVLAGAFAVLAGAFLDLVVRSGWWMSGRVLGETGKLAREFTGQMTAAQLQQADAVHDAPLFSVILGSIFSLGNLIALGGILFAFAAATAALYLLAVLAAPVMILSVIPEMGWLRGLWLKIVSLLAMLPIVAGGIFKAAMASVSPVDGLIGDVVHLLWLWGAAGLMLSLAGILGKFTISASADAAGKLVGAGAQIVGLAAAAATGVGAIGAVGAGVAGAVGGAAGVGGGAAGSAAGSMGAGAAGAASSAASNLQAAQSLTKTSAAMSTIGQLTGLRGFQAAGTMMRGQAAGYALAARADQVQMQDQRLSERVANFAPTHNSNGSNNFGFAPGINESIARTYQGTPEAFQEGFGRLSPYISAAGLDPGIFAQSYAVSGSLARMVSVYQDPGVQADVDGAVNPLLRAAQVANAQDVITDLFSTPS